MNESEGETLRLKIRGTGMSVGQAGDAMGITRRMMYYYFKMQELPEDLHKKVKDFLNITIVQNVPHETELADDSDANVNNNYLLQRRNIKNKYEPFLVPFVDIPAQAGYLKAYSHIDYIETLKKYPILPDIDPTGAVWRYFQVQGDSMEPEIRSGDVVLASQVPKDDWNQFQNYYTYVIVTEDELLIKDVYRESDRQWILLSQNEHHQPKLVNVEDIRQLWVMRRHIKNRAKKNRMYNIEEIKKQLKK